MNDNGCCVKHAPNIAEDTQSCTHEDTQSCTHDNKIKGHVEGLGHFFHSHSLV